MQSARHVFYTGRVQGVGFRYATKQLAKGFDVTGWVRNLADGRVELLVQAHSSQEVSDFLTELEENSAVAYHIKEKQSIPVPYLNGLSGFTITE
jgi:acylphosphatase